MGFRWRHKPAVVNWAFNHKENQKSWNLKGNNNQMSCPLSTQFWWPSPKQKKEDSRLCYLLTQGNLTH